MIKVEKDFLDIPNILTKKSREDAFNANIASASYCDIKNRYKVDSIQKRLSKIYHLKCAYCERKLLDSPKHIEHYRPKSTYYWLAYSWDNLLLCCGKCNSAKGGRFKVKNSVKKYDNEVFADIHNLGNSYDIEEVPFIINPEKENILDLIYFDKNGKIYSSDNRVLHTINDACNLNRDELVELRKKIVTNFINRINRHFYFFQKHREIYVFIPDVEDFLKNCKVENEFYAFRYFIINNIEIFFEDNILIQKILKVLFKKLK